VRTLRHFFRDRPAIAALLLAAALLLKIVVPNGYMPTAPVDGVVITLCSGTTMTLDLDRHDADKERSASTAAHPCAFAPLGDGLLGSAPIALLLAALAFAFVAAILAVPLALRPSAAGIRPPGQGPPRLT
jgi:hypothetical protein